MAKRFDLLLRSSTKENTPAFAEAFSLVNYRFANWNRLKKELLAWGKILELPSVKRAFELVRA